MDKNKYIAEVGKGYTVQYNITEQLFSGKSDFQKVEIYQTETFGKMLLNDDLVMITEKDEFVYHEMITHIPLFTHPQPQSVLIIGGGDGGTAREVLRHPAVKHCDMVEIDGMVVEACRQFIPQTAVGMEASERFKLHIADGVEWVKNKKAFYDLIIVDSTDPIGPAQPLFGKDFYQDIFNSLKDDGMVVSQAESPYYNGDMQAKLASIISGLFPKLWFLNFSNLTYPGGLWSFSVATKGLDPINDFNKVAFDKANMSFKYYNANIHKSCFSLPNFQKENIGQWIQN